MPGLRWPNGARIFKADVIANKHKFNAVTGYDALMADKAPGLREAQLRAMRMRRTPEKNKKLIDNIGSQGEGQGHRQGGQRQGGETRRAWWPMNELSRTSGGGATTTLIAASMSVSGAGVIRIGTA